MSPGLSLYLDVMRLTAALVVFVNHASYDRFGGSWVPDSISTYGHEAVVLFFVLSGFVISFVVDVKERDARAYAVARFSRLWSVALPAIAATILMDLAGLWLAPEVYSPITVIIDPQRIAASGLFLNEWWFGHWHVGSNGPYWSLSYEAAYYLLFGILVFVRKPWPWLLLAALLIGPKILLLLPAWVLGVVAYRHSQQTRSRNANWLLAIVGGTFATVLIVFKLGNIYVTWRWREWLGEDVFDAMGHAAYFVSDNLIAAGVAAHLVGVAGLLRDVAIHRGMKRVIAKASLATFPIYVMHYPALYFFTAVSVSVSGAIAGPAVGFAALMSGVVLTPFGEYLRRSLRNHGTRLFAARPVAGSQ